MIDIRDFASITGFDDGIEAYVQGAGTMTVQANGDITGGAGLGSAGVYTRAVTGATLIDANGNITGNSWAGVDAVSVGGNISVTGNGNLTSTGTGGISNETDGVKASAAGGDVAITGNGIISGADDGIEAYTTLAGTMTVQNNGDITGGAGVGSAGVYTLVGTGATLINGNGNITGNSWSGVNAASLGGNISITSNGDLTSTGIGGINNTTDGVLVNAAGGNVAITDNGIISGADDGIEAYTVGTGSITVDSNGNIDGTTAANNSSGVYAQAAAGAVAITNNGTIDGFGWNAIDVLTTSGNISVQNNGDITGAAAGAYDGILAVSGTGEVNIGGVKTGEVDIGGVKTDIFSTNGEIFGNYDGIGVSTAGKITIVVDENVTGQTHDGIWINSALNTSAANTIKILDTATVSGATVGNYLASGIALDIGAGTMVVDNFGTVTTHLDDGLSGTAGGTGVWANTGTNTVNNKSGGEIIGGLSVANGVQFTLNNEAGGLWIPSLHNFVTSPADINNAGNIELRAGKTVLDNGVTGADMHNLATGVIDMTYNGTSPLATDSLFVNDLSSAAGSKVQYNVNFTVANNTGTENAVATDQTTGTGGLGTADTIVFSGVHTASGGIVDLSMVGTAAVASSGSIALINQFGFPVTGSAVSDDPGLGGMASILANESAGYSFLVDPSTGAVIYKLVDDPVSGGLYLQWAPNITAESMGAFAGGNLSDASTSGSRIAGAAASGGVGGAGAGGGGAASQIGDIAAANSYGQAGASGGAVCGDGSRTTAWAAGDGASTNYDGGSEGDTANGSFGVDYDLSSDACGRFAIGAFGTIGHASSSFASGSSETDSLGAGAYARVAGGNGLYGLGLVLVGQGETEMTNAVFGSTATQDSTGVLGLVALGYSTRMSDTSALDMRAYASQAVISGDSFTDSVGVPNDGSEADITTVGLQATLSADLSEATTAFIGAGVRHVMMNQTINAPGTSISGKAEADYANLELGLRHLLADNVTLSAAGTGDFSKTSKSWGGKLGLAIKF